MMTMMDRAFHALRTWLGLADAHLTPGHGWLLPVPAEALNRRRGAEAARASAPVVEG